MMLLASLLTLAGVGAQQPLQLTAIDGPKTSTFPVGDVVTFQDQLYTANQYNLIEEGNRFSLVDTVGGRLEAIASDAEFTQGSVPSRESGAFQVVGDKLFATSFTREDRYEIFRIEGKQATKLTNLPGNPVSDIVAFRGDYYFLVTGAWIGDTEDTFDDHHHLELWKTDGTAEGTVKVEDLPLYGLTTLTYSYTQLIAGEEALLISGHDPEQPNYVSFVLYRPESGLTTVALPATLGGDKAVVYSDYAGRLSVPFFEGAFYLVAWYESESVNKPRVLRIVEEDNTLRSLPDLNKLHSRSVDKASFVATEDKLFLYLTDPYAGYGLYRATAANPSEFSPLIESDESTLEFPAARHGDSVYFAGVHDGQPHLSTVNIADEEIAHLTPLIYTYSRWNLHFGGSVIYGTEGLNNTGVFQFDRTGGEIRYADNLSSLRYGNRNTGVSVIGEDLVYVGRQAPDDNNFSARELFVWRSGASEPVVLGSINKRRPVGVSDLRGKLSDGRLLLEAFGEGALPEHLYNPASGSVDNVRPLTDSDYGSFLFGGYMQGSPLYTKRTVGPDSLTFYTIVDGRMVALRDAATGKILAMQGRFYGTAPGLIILTDDTQAYVSSFFIEGSEATRTDHVIAPGYSLTRYYSGERTAIRFRFEGRDSVVVFTSAGTRLYDFILPEGWSLAGFDDQGYTLHLHSAADSGPRLAYFPAGGGAEVSISLPEGVVPQPRSFSWQLGKRFLFKPYNATVGGEYYVADATTGSTYLLKDIYPGAADGSNGYSAVIDGILYFGGNDGESGTELWRTDGSPEGTYRVADINPGLAFSNPAHFYATPTDVFFSARGTTGREVYRMTRDGQESVSQVADVNPGGESSNPYDFLQVGDSLYFLAQPDVNEGFQLFSVKADATVTSVRKIAFRSKTKLFPNPTSGVFRIVAPADDPLAAVSIYDLQGRRVFAETVSASRFRANVTGLAAGQYVVRLSYASGQWEHRAVAILR